MKRLKNKVALITGGAGGIGKATTKLFLDEGAKVVLVDLNEEALKSATDELGGGESLRYVAADVSKTEEVKRYLQTAVNAFGKLDVLFVNAGIEGVVKPITDYPEDVFDKVIAVNVKGVWLAAKHGLSHLNDGGSLIITSSVAGLSGSPNVSAYITSKHGAVGVMRAVAIEAAPRKIRVNSIHPSPVETRMMRSLEEGFAPGQAAQAKQGMATAIPLGRYAEADEIADLALFLASDESRFITGTTQVIDGGMMV